MNIRFLGNPLLILRKKATTKGLLIVLCNAALWVVFAEESKQRSSLEEVQLCKSSNQSRFQPKLTCSSARVRKVKSFANIALLLFFLYFLLFFYFLHFHYLLYIHNFPHFSQFLNFLYFLYFPYFPPYHAISISFLSFFQSFKGH